MDDLFYSDILLAHRAGRGDPADDWLFKRSRVLPRVRAAIAAVRSFAPSNLLDIGSGRGAFLWPFIEAAPEVDVVSMDIEPCKAAVVGAVDRGLRAAGRQGPAAVVACATAVPFPPEWFDVVTVLEVLEHLRDPFTAASEAFRVCRGCVVATVPSRPDDNPEHLRLFLPEDLSRLFSAAGAARTRVADVGGSLLCVASR
jgi:ubiquinone/menaquinone biosynthesis C-methylase UbiE